jgi:hypothetical protein
MANNNTRNKRSQLNRKDRSRLVAESKPRNKWNTRGKVCRGKPKKSDDLGVAG